MIPIADIGAAHAGLQAEIGQAVREVLDSGQFILGPNVTAFEQEAAAYLGVSHAVSCGSGTDALQLALKALDVGPGDEVITSPFSFFATVEAIVNVGAKPVFVDIDAETFNMDTAQIEAAITPSTRIILPVHLFGQPVAMEAVLSIARRHSLRVIEDCAQSFGARRGNTYTGALGDIGAFSFFPTKILGACGDAGMMTTDSGEIAEKLRLLCNHGSNERNRHQIIGHNSRLDEIQAAILRLKLPLVNDANRSRQRIAGWYHAGLEDLDDIKAPVADPGGDHIFHQFTVLLPPDRREPLIDALTARGIASAVHYARPLYRQPALAGRYAGMRLPVAETISARCLSLPLYPELSRDQVDSVIRVVRESLAPSASARPFEERPLEERPRKKAL